jgi:hypothetical protein
LRRFRASDRKVLAYRSESRQGFRRFIVTAETLGEFRDGGIVNGRLPDHQWLFVGHAAILPR